MKKSKFNIDDNQIEQLYNALKGGAPLILALQYAGINRATYFYWVALASIVDQARSQDELEQMEKYFKSGISIQDVRDLSESMASKKRSGVSTFIEPSAESVMQYKNNKKFREYADKCYEVVKECDTIRSQLALYHLDKIRSSTDKNKRINASGSMWFLERTLPDFFAKPSDKATIDSESKTVVEPVKVEYVNPNTQETKDRIAEMEEDLIRKFNGEGRA